jgi:hypothetical protein
MGEMDEYIAEWVANNANRIFQASFFNGGWERWTQVELTFFLVTDPFQYEFWREQDPYDDATFEIDIWLRHSPADNSQTSGSS